MKTTTIMIALLLCMAAVGQTNYTIDNRNIDFRGKNFFRQPITVGDTGTVPSALADFKSTSKGVLLPRVTTGQMLSISAPANGLLIYNTDSAKFYYYTSGIWTQIGAGDLSFTQTFNKYLLWNYDTFALSISGPGDDNEFTFTYGDLRATGSEDSCTLYIVTNVANVNATRQIRMYSDYEVEMQTPRNKIRLLDNTLLDISRDSSFVFGVDTAGLVSIGGMDSIALYAITPSVEGTLGYCTDCTGNGITGRVVAYVGAAWRRIMFE